MARLDTPLVAVLLPHVSPMTTAFMTTAIQHFVSALVLVGVFCTTTSGRAQERREIPDFRTYGEPESVADAGRVDTLIQEFKDTWKRQDTVAFIALHADNVEWINAYARLIRDAPPLNEFIGERLFPAFDSAVSREEIANMRLISIRYLGTDAAVVHLYTDGARGASRNSGEKMRRTHIHLVLEKRNADWKIVHTAIMDAR